MSEFYDRAAVLRATEEPHYNCCASVVIPFAEKAGITEETAMRITANFRHGMVNEGRCGAVCGGLMVLGLFGVKDEQTVLDYYQTIKDSHEGMLECGALLKANEEKGLPKKPHCDGIVFEVVNIVEDILKEKGLL